MDRLALKVMIALNSEIFSSSFTLQLYIKAWRLFRVALQIISRARDKIAAELPSNQGYVQPWEDLEAPNFPSQCDMYVTEMLGHKKASVFPA